MRVPVPSDDPDLVRMGQVELCRQRSTDLRLERDRLEQVYFTWRLVDAWVEFIKRLDSVWKFDWYATLTFRGNPHPEAARKSFDLWVHKLNREKWGPRYWRRTHGITGVLAEEFQRRGTIHYHALLATGGMHRLRAMDLWDAQSGMARIWPFRREGGAEQYVSKYVAKEGNISIIGKGAAPRLLQRRLDA